MTDSDLQHGHHWDRVKDLTGWELTEKIDGCRAYWDGTRFWTRSENIITAPPRITSCLPATPLDGEMYGGRGGFARASTAVRHGTANDADRKWDGIAFAPFSGLPVTVCRGNAHALNLMREVQQGGGEGLMARKPGIVWCAGRTVDLLKIK
jgi:DNA ligase-1